MPCDSSVAQTVLMNVTAGSLPEGFCPNSMQELFDAMVARMIVTPNQAFTSFAAGSVEPTSNVGPWLKDCEVWFIFDPSTGSYIPMAKGGFDSMQYIETSQDFIVPPFIYKLKIHAFGAGGGGFAAASASGGGGGGAYGLAIRDVTPGQVIPIVIGTGGGAGANGGDTTILGMTAGGGFGGTAVTTAGAGGTALLFDVNLIGQHGQANAPGTSSNSDSNGGDAGGWGGKGGVIGANGTSAGRTGTSPGGGGSGSANAAVTTPGNGASGAVLIEY